LAGAWSMGEAVGEPSQLLPLKSLLPRLLGLEEEEDEHLLEKHHLSKNNDMVMSSLSSSASSSSLLSSKLKLIHLSLLAATPGSSDQSWHADGGHTSLEQHHPCHCFNVFLPLQDTPHSMGPTEIRPAFHYLTRGQSLARNILLAKYRKTLIPLVWPALYQGDVLIFDYRILHRGRANIRRLQNRNYLVFTYAQPWFCDVLNFPKHPSIYDKKWMSLDTNVVDHDKEETTRSNRKQ
jgi:ectoine hydroxylase-related dioxygenase (phytanoyl-CoA dioxygenase family)